MHNAQGVRGFGRKSKPNVELRGIYFQNLITSKVLFRRKNNATFIKKMYLGQYLEILNTFVILLGIKLIIKQ
jgi:hypothetical protein